MRFPKYPATAYKAPAVSVLEGYIDFVGTNERDNRDAIDALPPTDLLQTAMRIGRGCMIVANGNDKAADRMFRRAQRDLWAGHLTSPKQRRSRAGRFAAELASTAQMLEFRDDSAAIAEARQAAHMRTVKEIGMVRDQLLRTDRGRPQNGQLADLHGDMAHRVGLGLLTRYSAHPWFMGAPALLHHDQGEVRHDNFDILFVETSSVQRASTSHKIQVKGTCLGVCNEPQGKQIDRTEYASDIVFLSGCCDLGLRGDTHSETRYAMADLLIKEATDAATPEEIRELDIATDSLMLSLTMGDSRRMGLQDVPAPQYA